MFKCAKSSKAAGLSMIPTILMAVFAANQSGHSQTATPAPQAQAGVTALYQQQREKLPAAQLDINPQARHFIMLDEPAWLNDKIGAFLQEAK